MIRRLFGVLLAGVLLATAALPALAGSTVGWGGVTVTTPDTYGSCSATGDTITVTGLTSLNETYANPDINFTIEGWVDVQYVLPGGDRQTVPNGYQVVLMAVDGVIQVTYPPAYDWPLTDPVSNTAEIHVDLALQLVARNAVNGIVEFLPPPFGPGIDWDVFCQNPPPPPPSGPGTGTPGYWKNHPEAWPVDSITIGGVTYSKADALYWMDQPDGDKSVTLFRALVSAKLNVLIGNDDSCVADTIVAADDWLAAYGPVGSGVKAKSAAWKQGEPLSLTLDNYNNGLLCAPHRD